MNKKHGYSPRKSKPERLYNIWREMKSRCYTKGNSSYHLYGRKGVTVCEEWKNDYLAFRTWAKANGYEEHLTIDKDYLCKQLDIWPKVYSPKTCRWITREENAITNRLYSDDEELQIVNKYTIDKWTTAVIAKKLKVDWNTIKSILIRHGVYKKTTNDPVTKEQWLEVEELRNKGVELKDALLTVGISRSPYYRAAKRYKQQN